MRAIQAEKLTALKEGQNQTLSAILLKRACREDDTNAGFIQVEQLGFERPKSLSSILVDGFNTLEFWTKANNCLGQSLRSECKLPVSYLATNHSYLLSQNLENPLSLSVVEARGTEIWAPSCVPGSGAKERHSQFIKSTFVMRNKWNEFWAHSCVPGSGAQERSSFIFLSFSNQHIPPGNSSRLD